MKGITLANAVGMRSFMVGVLVIGAAIGCNGENPASPAQGTGVIVAFGDSLTAGPGVRAEQTYPALLQDRITSEGREYLVINRGVSGDTSSDALLRFDAYTRLADRYKVTLVPFILLGIIGNNDLDLDDGLHPNAAGHKVIADTIWPYLRPML